MSITRNGRPMQLGKYCYGLKHFAGYCENCKEKVYINTEDMKGFLKNAGYDIAQNKRKLVVAHLIANFIPESVRNEVIHSNAMKVSINLNKQSTETNRGFNFGSDD